MGWCGLDAYGSWQGQVVGSCEQGYKPLFSTKCKTAQLNEELLASQGLHSKEMHDPQHLQL